MKSKSAQQGNPAVKLLVFTDLDGSLMEHETYSIEAARPALEELRNRGIVLVMNSSKTAAEMLAIQKRLELDAPFVCENGAALYFPVDAGARNQVFGRLRSEWLPAVHDLRADLKLEFEGFADWSPKQVADITGLDVPSAELAKKREYSEPILWRSPASARLLFIEELEKLGLGLLEGGRFLSIQGEHDKSIAMHWLARQQQDEKTITVGLGDSPNDTAMLEAANIAVIIKSAKSDRIQLANPDKIIHTSRPGPAGWQDAITEILIWLDSDELSAIGR